MNCKDYVFLISDYIENELKHEDRVLLEEHFHDCDNCRSFFQSFKSSIELVEYLKTEQCPPEVVTRLDRLMVEKIRQKKSMQNQSTDA